MIQKITKSPKSLADRAYYILEEMIVTLKLAPGSLISEAKLSKEIDIGRTPLREALQRLTQERLVSVLPRRGMIITEVNIMDQLEIVKLRRVVDRLIVANATKWLIPEQNQQLYELADAIIEAAKEDDSLRFIHLDGEFDQIVQIASRNYFASQVAETTHAHCRRFWYMNRAASDLVRSAELHANIMKATAEGNQKKAEIASDLLSDYIDEFTRSTIDL
ncbi:GntR family transcriptional regulator [Maribacter antarcticus]|uniref:GntR family transcriptional regulator n=1 Tax=Maribacter antarcticus TaxID=505250 RepID=UPI00047A10EE|nr:GntR family transcriptional regulator [Maribacter antarcticus]